MKRRMDKIGIVMSEYKNGDLQSSSGDEVTNPKQAIAIALNEQKKADAGSFPTFKSQGGFNEDARKAFRKTTA